VPSGGEGPHGFLSVHIDEDFAQSLEWPSFVGAATSPVECVKCNYLPKLPRKFFNSYPDSFTDLIRIINIINTGQVQ